MFTWPVSPLSLKIRLSAIMGAVFLVGMVALYVAARTSAEAAANRSFDRLLLGSALSITETIAVSGGRVRVDLPYASLDMLSAAPQDRVFYSVTGPNEQLVTGAGDLPARPVVHDLAVSPVRVEANAPIFFDAIYSGETVRFAVLGRQVAEPGATGWLWVQVGQTRRARDQLKNELILNALTPITAMGGLAFAVVWLGIGGALMPLTRIGRELKTRDPSDLHPITAPVPKEVAPLVESLNDFMRRLDANIQAMKALIAEAAHQMRTPLAVIHAQAQVASGGDDEDRRRGLLAIERSSAKLSRLLQQLLSDATVAHRADVRAFEDFDLLRVVRAAVRDSTPMALNREAKVQTSLKSAPFHGDALLFGEAVKNLIDNAFTHGRGGEKGVEVQVEAKGGGYVITVSDRGDGVDAAVAGRIFERFSAGRARTSGAGLGMAIVRRAMDTHGGEVTLNNREGGGLQVRLHAPRRT